MSKEPKKKIRKKAVVFPNWEIDIVRVFIFHSIQMYSSAYAKWTFQYTCGCQCVSKPLQKIFTLYLIAVRCRFFDSMSCEIWNDRTHRTYDV